jgi:hypothetical protein
VEHGGDPGEVIAGAEARINHAPAPSRRRSAGSLQARDDRRRDAVKITGSQEQIAVTQLLGTVTARRRTALPTAKEIDIALAGEVEAVTIAPAAGARSSRQIGQRSSPWPGRGESGATVPLHHHEEPGVSHLQNLNSDAWASSVMDQQRSRAGRQSYQLS